MPGEVIEGINPTRMELLSTRRKRILAEKGHKLLGEKRDALVVQFFDIIKRRKELRSEVRSSFEGAQVHIQNAMAVLGYETIRSYTLGIEPYPAPRISMLNIMGVRVPTIEGRDPEDKDKPWSLGSTPQALDDSMTAYRGAIRSLLKLAEVESAMERIAVEIEKTKRRVNALEHIFIPRLRNTERYITMQLQEREREDFFRRKRIKAIMENKALEAGRAPEVS
ncbi:MAG: V-type ATP synthase subunit D [Candidatus Thermoplasmatota archaeon]|nr:V-type ATP synthase subunit D [Candidatus Thermoplasmatota archaeon]